MSALRRRKKESASDPESAGEGLEALDDSPDSDADDALSGAGKPGRPDGPWDVEDAPEDDVARLDLGSLRVPVVEGMEIQVNLDEASGVVAAVTLLVGDSALQLQAFAAPRNEGIWDEVRRELAGEITRDGGVADLIDGDAGPELRAQLPITQPDGSRMLAPVRFIGCDGERWLLRGVVSGAAATDVPKAAELLNVYVGTVVVRGTEAFAPRDLLPLRLPEPEAAGRAGEGEGESGAARGPGERESLDLDGTGQRITEIR